MDNYDEKKGDMQMKNKKAIKVLQWTGVLLLAVVMLLGTITAPMAEASKLEASHIEKLENVKVDYQKSLDSSVMQKLPQHIRDDETISVIVNRLQDRHFLKIEKVHYGPMESCRYKLLR